uniref:Uncharacterized protein n=1 Tax=Arundo donax TaxID=35708 RepID=A0A0A9D8H6_ARUDO
MEGESGVGGPCEAVSGGIRVEPPAHDQNYAAVLRVGRYGDGDGVAQPWPENLEGGRLHAPGAVHDELHSSRTHVFLFQEESQSFLVLWLCVVCR